MHPSHEPPLFAKIPCYRLEGRRKCRGFLMLHTAANDGVGGVGLWVHESEQIPDDLVDVLHGDDRRLLVTLPLRGTQTGLLVLHARSQDAAWWAVTFAIMRANRPPNCTRPLFIMADVNGRLGSVTGMRQWR